MLKRWWTYQQERFPLAAHGPLVAALAVSAVGHSALLRGEAGWPGWAPVGTAFGVGLLFFLLMRVADEHKDAEKDRRYRPDRPVPRGLVTLRALRTLGAAAAGLQLVLTLALAPALLPLLLLAWTYLGLMTAEFFVPRWLEARPALYLLSHMVILPLVALYLTGCDWRAAGAGWPGGLAWFLGATFFGGVVVEVGRKVRAPADEQEGVETYTAAWGVGRAVGAWLAAMTLAMACATLAAARVGFAGPALVVMGALLAGSALAAFRFLRRPTPGRARLFEPAAGAWTLGQYAVVGIAPLFL